jgi:hypothetical protein
MGVREFVLTPLNDPDQTRAGGLHLYDPVAGGTLIKVSGLDGKPLEPLGWALFPARPQLARSWRTDRTT